MFELNKNYSAAYYNVQYYVILCDIVVRYFIGYTYTYTLYTYVYTGHNIYNFINIIIVIRLVVFYIRYLLSSSIYFFLRSVFFFFFDVNVKNSRFSHAHENKIKIILRCRERRRSNVILIVNRYNIQS